MNATGIEIHRGIPFADYLQWPEPSQTTLKAARKSLAHYKAARDGERVIVPTDDMLLGSALHTCFLEPWDAANRIAVWPADNGPRKGKEWAEFKAENSGRIMLTEAASLNLRGMVESLRRHKTVKEWLSRIEAVEVSARGELDGVQVKARCDALSQDPLIDLKKVRDASYEAMQRAVMNFGYDIQAAMYRRMFQRERFILVCVEDEPPYDVVAYELAPSMLRRADTILGALLAKVKEAEELQQWPGQCDEIVELELPGWLVAMEENSIEYGA